MRFSILALAVVLAASIASAMPSPRPRSATDPGRGDAPRRDGAPVGAGTRGAARRGRRLAPRSRVAVVQQPRADRRADAAPRECARRGAPTSGPRHRPAARDRRPAGPAARGRGRARWTRCAPRSTTPAARRAPTRRLRFHAVLAAQRRVQLEQRSVDLFDGTAQAVAKRRAAGEDTRLDANVALIEAERARNALALAREQLARRTQRTRRRRCNCRRPACPRSSGDLACRAGDAPPYSLDQCSRRCRPCPAARAGRTRRRRARPPGRRARQPLPGRDVGLSSARRPAATRASADDAVAVGAAAAVQAQRRRDRPGSDGRDAGRDRARDRRCATRRPRCAGCGAAWRASANVCSACSARCSPASADNQQLAAQVAAGRADRPARPAARQPPGARRRARTERRAGRIPRHPDRTRTRGRLAAGRNLQDDHVTRQPRRRLRLRWRWRWRRRAPLAGCGKGAAKDEHAAEATSTTTRARRRSEHAESEELTLTSEEAERAGIKVEEIKAQAARRDGRASPRRSSRTRTGSRASRRASRAASRRPRRSWATACAPARRWPRSTASSVGEAHAAWMQAQSELRIAEADFKRAER